MADILVTGGAGYIGSVTVALLIDRGHDVTILDNLSRGHVLHPQARFVQADLTDASIAKAFDRSYDAIIHFAGLISVGESVHEPQLYERVNVQGSRALLAQMKRVGCANIIFSSSAAVYGAPDHVPIEEDAPLRPVSPYGQSKLAIEQALADGGFHHVILRYFNAAGAHENLGERHEPETHLIPLALRASTDNPLRLFGTDYPTADGTCIRDYIHVADLAEAHILATEHLLAGKQSCKLNLGSGVGYSVREVIAACERALGRSVPVRPQGRREGDPPALVASYARAQRILGWRPTRDIRAIVADALAFERGAR